MYLVQRCSVKPHVKVYENQKVSEYFELDYMGSAEFEFGAIPKSIRKMANKADLTTAQFKYKNQKGHSFTIHVVASNKEMGDAFDEIKKLLNVIDAPRQLKEGNSFGRRVREEDGYDRKETLWWCVDEDCNRMIRGTEPPAEKNRIASEDPQLNFAWSLDPEQARCFKLALASSLAFMNKGA